MSKFIKWLLQSNGFTLLEAIISVAIVGMVIVPISMVFNGTLQQTMEAKDLLKANQLAQLYVENIKAKPEAELEYFFSHDPDDADPATSNPNSRLITSAVNGFPAVPNSYSVELQYKKGVGSLALVTTDAYKVKSPTEKPKVDFEINLLSAADRKFNLKFNNNLGSKDYEGIGTERVIQIIYESASTIKVIDPSIGFEETISTSTLFSPSPSFHYAFSLNCLATDLRSIYTKVILVNKTEKPVTCYVYQTEKNTVNPDINDMALGGYEGPIKVEDNLNTLIADSSDYKIYSVKVIVRDRNNNVLTTLDATKIDE